MDVHTAIAQRHSVRQFRSDEVDIATLQELLTLASRAPSGGNLQPWRIYVLAGESMARFRSLFAGSPPLSQPEYSVYPPKVTEPYRSNRYQLGEAMYATLGIPREDKQARLAQFAKNADFFGAPAALFCFVDRQMSAPQWSDCGMFLQTLMLAAVAKGLGTCAQEYWAVHHEAVSEFVGAPENEQLFCGLAIGYPDNDAPINSLQSARMPLADFARFV